MVRVDIRCDFKDKTGKFRLFWQHHPFFSLSWAGVRGYLHEAIEQLLHTEVVERRAEEYWSHLSIEVGIDVKLRIHTVYQFQVVAQFRRIFGPHPLIEVL